MVIDLKQRLKHALTTARDTVAPGSQVEVMISRPKVAEHGDFACNLALLLAKPLARAPRELAAALVAAMPSLPEVDSVAVAGAGFINIRLSALAKTAVVGEVLRAREHYGRQQLSPQPTLLLEYVSANPTGPLHVGHGRGAAYGASLAGLLRFAGWRVDEEYYVNDAGRQMDILGLSTWLRYLELCGAVVDFPANAYQGDYVREMAADWRQRVGNRDVIDLSQLPKPPQGRESADREADKAAREAHIDEAIAFARQALGQAWPEIRRHALETQLADCRDDLAEFGVRFGSWRSEQGLFDDGQVAAVIAALSDAGHTYREDGALWFRSTAFGDEKDRVLQRDNGLYTYFASDIAYHAEKLRRGYDRCLNIWGADHHGYIARVKGAISALGLPVERLDIALVQFAVLYKNGEKASMSTRSGEYVTLRTLRQDVGNDACRFFYTLRKSDQHLDFDLDLAKRRSQDNPVYYIQYAHARASSLLNEWGGEPTELESADLSLLSHERELALIGKIGEFSETITLAAHELAPHQLAYYLKDTVGLFHAWYNDVRILGQGEALSRSRLALVSAFRELVRNALTILGVSCPESM